MMGGGEGGGSGTSQRMSAGDAIAGGGALIKGLAGYAAGRYNAKLARYNKQMSANDAVAEESLLRDQARQAMGEQIARQGVSGVQLGTGSALDALHESAVNEQLDIMTLRRKAAGRALGYDIEAANQKAMGKAALIDGATKAAISAFGGGGDYGAAG